MQNVQTYRYQGQPVFYKKVGKGKPLLLLHGWGSKGDVMVPLAQQLSDLRTCYIFDLPGFGDSPAPDRPWAVDDYANLIEQFLKDQHLTQTDLLVHSFGGRISLKLCARPRNRRLIDKVLITGGAGMKPRRSLSYYVKRYAAKLLKAPFYLLPAANREKALAKLRQTSVWQSLGSSDYQKLDGVMRRTFVNTVTEYLEPCLSDIPHEVLLLWGVDDQATPLYQAQRMEDGIKNAALVTIDHAGHYAFLDQSNQFNAIARAFFEE